jgi:heme A synthase
MARRYLSTALLLIAQVLLGGWALIRMLEPDMVLELLRSLTFC